MECLCFCNATADVSICYSRSTFQDPIAFSDANLSKWRSQTGYVAYLANGPVFARSVKQKCVVLSSCEAELVALSAAACDVMWLRHFLTELGFPPRAATPIHCDNDAAKRVAENPISGKGLRHVDRRHFFVQDVVAIKAITVPRVDSKNNLADALTKIIDNSVYFNFGASMLRSWTMAC